MAFTDLMGRDARKPPGAARARVLEVGAGAGRLARAPRGRLRRAGARERRRPCRRARRSRRARGLVRGGDRRRLAPPLDPLDDSCRRLGELVEPGGTLLLDEFAVGALTPLPLRGGSSSAARARRTPFERILAALQPHFELGLGPPLRGAWLHRWNSASRCARSKRRRSPPATCAPWRGHPLRSGSKVSLARRTDDSKGGEI
jgi:hypothetical protein